MLHIIVDGYCKTIQRLSRVFRIPVIWQTNLMTLANQGQGIAHLLALEQGLTDGQWMVASPIIWQATHNDAMITDVCSQPSHEDFKAFHQFLAQDASRLVEHPSGWWLFEVTNMQALTTPPLETVLHQSLFPFLDDMPPWWRTWFTETQMLWAQVDDTPVNGIWPWGGGHMNMDKSLYAIDASLWPICLGDLYPWEPKSRFKKQDAILLLTESQWLQYYDEITAAHRELWIWWNNGIEHISSSFWKFWIKK